MSKRERVPGFPAREGRSYRDLERAAIAMRISAGLGPTDPLDPRWFFENLNRFEFGLLHGLRGLDYAVEPVPGGFEADTRVERRSIVVRLSPQCYAELESKVPRAAFTVGHEVGHAVLHQRELLELASIPHGKAALHRGNLPDPPVYRDVEWQANGFASALLMPAEALHILERDSGGELTVELVQARFGVSASAAEIRIENFRGRRAILLS